MSKTVQDLAKFSDKALSEELERREHENKWANKIKRQHLSKADLEALLRLSEHGTDWMVLCSDEKPIHFDGDPCPRCFLLNAIRYGYNTDYGIFVTVRYDPMPD